MPAPSAFPAAKAQLGWDRALGSGPQPPPAPPSCKAKRRFDIESLLSEPDPPRRGGGGGGLPPAPAAWAAWPPVGCDPFASLFLAQRSPTGPGCRRPGLDLPGCFLAHHPLVSPLPWRPGGPCKMKRVRTVFTPEQLERLEKEFLKQQYMVGTERVDLAAHLHLTETQVKVWFQNRRIKWRKQSLEQKEAKRAPQGTIAAGGGEEKDDCGENDIEVED